MFDLTLCVLATSKNEKALRQFIEIGRTKSSRKIKTVFLADINDEKPEFVLDDWEAMDCPLSCRFANYLCSSKIDSKWLLQVADDSCTDLDRTLDVINGLYDHQDPVIIAGSSIYLIGSGENRTHMSVFMEDNIKEVLHEMGVKHLFPGVEDPNKFDLMPHFRHSWESSMISSAGARKISMCESAREFLRCCHSKPPFYGDQVPYVAAKLSKVPVSECSIFCPFPIAARYTGINRNGIYTHIHHVVDYWDELDNFKKILASGAIFDNEKEAGESLRNSSIDDGHWYLTELKNGQKVILDIMKTKSDGSVEFQNRNNARWLQNGSSIFLGENDGGWGVEFAKIGEGLYESNHSESNYFMERMDVISLIGLVGNKRKLQREGNTNSPFGSITPGGRHQ